MEIIKNVNLFTLLEILYRNQNMKAIKENGCQIAWRYKSSNPELPEDKKRKQLVFIDVYGGETTDILTNFMIAQQDFNVWSIVLDKGDDDK